MFNSFMNLSDAMTIQAFTAILPQLDTTLSQDLKQAVHGVGQQVHDHEAEAAAHQIRVLVNQHECLKEPFESAYERLREQYQVQQRPPSILATTTAIAPVETDLDEITLPILTADDFLTAAKDFLTGIQHRLQKTSQSVQAYVLSLQLSVAKADAQAIALLRALDRRLRTPRELAHLVNLPFDQVQATLQALWKKGYVEPVGGHTLYKVFPMLRSPQLSRTVDPDTYFTLTSKGHFFLHPFISFNRQSRSFL